MMDAHYYRERAERARQLAHGFAHRPDVAGELQKVARDYDEIVADLERGAIEVRHPELMPQARRGRTEP
jgi:hypothetical protein